VGKQETVQYRFTYFIYRGQEKELEVMNFYTFFLREKEDFDDI